MDHRTLAANSGEVGLAMENTMETNTMPPPAPEGRDWVQICAASSVPLDRGVGALFGEEQVAIFRLSPTDAENGTDEWFAVGNIDPRTDAPVMARGLVGSTGGDLLEVAFVASPLHKERYNLATGHCLDSADARLPVFEVRVNDGTVEIRSPAETSR